MKEDVVKHLELVQGVVTRMAANSFLLKGWTVTLTAALFALAAKDSNATFAVIALLPALSFWGLDAYYLRQERLFRRLYDELRLASDETLRTVEPFSMSTKEYAEKIPSWFQTLWAHSILAIHGVVVLAVVAAVIIIRVWAK